MLSKPFLRGIKFSDTHYSTTQDRGWKGSVCRVLVGEYPSKDSHRQTILNRALQYLDSVPLDGQYRLWIP